MESWDGGIEAFVPFEEKDKFEEIENNAATFTYTLPTERVNSDFHNSWRSSGAVSTYHPLAASSNLLKLFSIVSPLTCFLCSATSLIV